MSKEEMVAEMNRCAAELGRPPKRAEFEEMSDVSLHQIRKGFGNYAELLAASGVQREGCGYRASMQSLFADWARVVREKGKIPTMTEYEVEGKFSIAPMIRRFGAWKQAPAGMLEYARQQGLEAEWEDVLKIIADHMETQAKKTQRSELLRAMHLRPRIREDETIYGEPMHPPLNCAPTNENGVIFAFGSMAKELGFSILQIQAGYPDCRALRRVGPNRWVLVRIEFEYESHNFVTHMHEITGCDMIVCWRHNWADCPLEVLALEKLFNMG
jgi:HNH endonuclease